MSSTEEKVDIMLAYLNGKDIAWVGKGIQACEGIHNVKNERDDCSPMWNWGDTSYEIVPDKIKTEKFTNVIDGAVYRLFATKKEAIYHSDNRYDRAGVKVKIEEVLEN